MSLEGGDLIKPTRRTLVRRMTRLLALLAALVLIGPIVVGPHLLRGPGLEVRLPRGWYGQACGLHGGPNPGIRASTLRLRPECRDDLAYFTQKRLRQRDLLVIVARQFVSRQAARYCPPGKLQFVRLAAEPLEGQIAPAEAFVCRRINRRFFFAVAFFGKAHPPRRALEVANHLLARVRFSRQ
jgi:hypothetical protein